MKKVFLIPLFLAVFVMTGCGEKKDDGVLRIGAVLPLTGTASIHGQSERKGILLAVKEINENGGVLGKPAEVVFEDDATDAKKSVSAVHKLIDVDEVDVIVGGTWDFLANAIIPVIDKEQMVLLTPSALPDTLQAESEYLFAVHSPVALNQKIFERYLSNYDEPQRVAILSVNVPWGIAHAETFKKALANTDHELVEEILLPEFDGNDLLTEVTKLQAADVDVVLSAVNFNDYMQLPRRFVELGLDVDLLAHNNMYNALARGEIDAALMRGVAIFRFSAPSVAFQNAYREEFNEEPIIYADTAYDAVQLIARAAIYANTADDTAAIHNGLRNIESYVGASGLLDFSEQNHTNNKQPRLKIHDGVALREFVVGDVL